MGAVEPFFLEVLIKIHIFIIERELRSIIKFVPGKKKWDTWKNVVLVVLMHSVFFSLHCILVHVCDRTKYKHGAKESEVILCYVLCLTVSLIPISFLM